MAEFVHTRRLVASCAFFAVSFGYLVSSGQASLYTEGPGVNPPFEEIRDDITNGYSGTLIDVNNAAVEGGLYGELDTEDDLAIHTLAQSVVSEVSHGNWTRWYQTDGATQVFRLFPGEVNVQANSSGDVRPFAARIEAFDRNTGWNVDDGEWHDWVARYTIVKPIDAGIFQAKDTDNDDWSVTLNMDQNGKVFVTNRRPLPGQPKTETLIENAIGQPFDIRFRDNGLDYEVYFGEQTQPFTSGQYIRNDEPGDNTDTRFRWGIYVGGNPVLSEGMIFVSHASVDPDIDIPTGPPLQLFMHDDMPLGSSIIDRPLWFNQSAPGSGDSLADLGGGFRGNSFFNHGFVARTLNTSGSSSFDAKLVLAGSGPQLINLTNNLSISELIVDSDALFAQRRNNQLATIGNLALNAEVLIREQSGTAGNANFAVDEIGGAGVLKFGANSADIDNRWGFDATDADDDFTGSILLDKGILEFSSSAVELSQATLQILDIDANSQISLLNDASFLAFEELDAKDRSVVTLSVAPGTYSATDLDALFGTSGRFIGGGTLTVLGASGDFDGDGGVDGADFLQWQRNNGTAAGLTAWQDTYGTPAMLVASSASVPEPSTLMLTCLGLGRTFSRSRSVAPRLDNQRSTGNR